MSYHSLMSALVNIMTAEYPQNTLIRVMDHGRKDYEFRKEHIITEKHTGFSFERRVEGATSPLIRHRNKSTFWVLRGQYIH